MSIQVEFLENKKLKAKFDGFEIISDQPVSNGGDNEAPSPYDYFPVSTALCAGYYARVFLEKRGLDLNTVKVSQRMEKAEGGPMKRKIIVNLEFSPEFPEKYKDALIASVKSCAVKKVVESGPVFEVETA